MAARNAAEVNIAVVYLPPDLLPFQRIQAVMVLGMVGHLVALGHHPANEVRLLAHAPPYHEKGYLDALLLEDVQKLATGWIMGSIVDGDGDFLEVSVAVFEDARGGVEQVLLAPSFHPVGW